MNATSKQIVYINKLLEWCDERNILSEALSEINPDLMEEEDFTDWIKRQDVGKASEVIDILREVLDLKH